MISLAPSLTCCCFAARISASMKERKNSLLEGMFGCFEWLGKSETLFEYVVIPVLCIVGL